MQMKPALLLAALLLSACAPTRQEAPPPALSPTTAPVFIPATFDDLPGWKSDKVLEAKPALLRSCEKILRKGPDDKMGEWMKAGDWQPFCRDLMLQPDKDEAGFRSLLATQLRPYALTNNGDDTGLFTGYYEASLRGSRLPGGNYTTPLYKRPPELVTVDLGLFREEWKGQRTAGYVENGRLRPFDDRTKIAEGSLANRGLELLWLDDEVDAFFAQIQGSARVKLSDGKETRIGFDAQNGYSYTAIGRELVKEGEIKKEDVSMDSIRAWLITHPAQAKAIMNRNQSYVFFREIPLNAGPQGAEGTLLTAGRSLAVDPRYTAYGTPVWLDAESPLGGRLQRLLVAQDTGGAITGPVRGDVFWGYGKEAEKAAGNMKSKGRYFVLLPKSANVPQKATP